MQTHHTVYTILALGFLTVLSPKQAVITALILLLVMAMESVRLYFEFKKLKEKQSEFEQAIEEFVSAKSKISR